MNFFLKSNWYLPSEMDELDQREAGCDLNPVRSKVLPERVGDFVRFLSGIPGARKVDGKLGSPANLAP